MPLQTPSPDEYPDLFREYWWEWGPIRGQFEFTEEAPPAEMISNVRMVPFVGDQVVVIRMDDGMWNHPGGGLEPGESYINAVERELMEEAGARLASPFRQFGVLHCWSEAEKPFRPHLPFPEFFHVVGYAEVELAGKPTNPADGETVVDVVTLPLEEACERLVSDERNVWQADMYRLAARVRGGGLAG